MKLLLRSVFCIDLVYALRTDGNVKNVVDASAVCGPITVTQFDIEMEVTVDGVSADCCTAVTATPMAAAVPPACQGEHPIAHVSSNGYDCASGNTCVNGSITYQWPVSDTCCKSLFSKDNNVACALSTLKAMRTGFCMTADMSNEVAQAGLSQTWSLINLAHAHEDKVKEASASNCWNSCWYRDQSHTCYDRVKYVVGGGSCNSFGGLGGALALVNLQCLGQCDCVGSDFSSFCAGQPQYLQASEDYYDYSSLADDYYDYSDN